MKKIIFSTIMVFAASSLMFAQTEMDALKYLESDLTGTARYTAMSGAFSALGGDISAIKDNPAGLGVYRSSEIGVSLGSMLQTANALWDGTTARDNMTRLKMNNIGFVLSTPSLRSLSGSTSGLQRSNFGFTYNKLKNFDRKLSVNCENMEASLTDLMSVYANQTMYDIGYIDMSDYSNNATGWLSVLGYNGYLMNIFNENGETKWMPEFAYDPNNESYYPVKPSYTLMEKGYMDEYGFTWSGNFANRFYLGVGVNIQTLSYSLSSSYREDDDRYYFRLRNEYTASGIGVNVKIGAICKITDALRISAAIHTPTGLTLRESYYPVLDYYTVYYEPAINDFAEIRGTTHPSSSAASTYSLTTPLRLNTGVAYVIGKKGLISAEYDCSLNPYAEYAERNGNPDMFSEENAGMRSMYRSEHLLKLGGEFRLTPNLSLRAGTAFQTGITTDNAEKIMWYNTARTDAEYFLPKYTNYASVGIGYQEDGWYIDFAYQYKGQKMQFMPFNAGILDADVPAADITVSSNSLVATVGLRF